MYKEGFLDIYWPPGEFEYIKLVADRKLDRFYTEFKQHFLKFCKSKKSKEIFLESVELNKKMMRLPWSDDDEMLDLNYNIIESYQDILKLNKPNIVSKNNKIKIIRTDMKFNDIQHWMREVIWYGHRSGKYTCKIEGLNNNSNNEILNEQNASKIIGNSYIV